MNCNSSIIQQMLCHVRLSKMRLFPSSRMRLCAIGSPITTQAKVWTSANTSIFAHFHHDVPSTFPRDSVHSGHQHCQYIQGYPVWCGAMCGNVEDEDHLRRTIVRCKRTYVSPSMYLCSFTLKGSPKIHDDVTPRSWGKGRGHIIEKRALHMNMRWRASNHG